MNTRIKAVGLFSGGLDSCLAAKIMADQGVEVYCLYCILPWDGEEKVQQQEMAEALGCHFETVYLGLDYLAMLQNPQHGYGSAFNPCIDCHRFMVIKAGELMRKVGAQFLFSGEVVGQRPMSQRRACLPLIEKGTDYEGLLVRPLSAKLLTKTIPEENGWVTRENLFDFSGRSRRPQMDLAAQLGVTDYSPPAGGCLLTEKDFALRFKDFLDFGYSRAEEARILSFGRYFRIDRDHIAVAGRDEEENRALETYAVAGDRILDLVDVPSPILILRGKTYTDDIMQKAAGLVQWYSKARNAQPGVVEWSVIGSRIKGQIAAETLTQTDLMNMKRGLG